MDHQEKRVYHLVQKVKDNVGQVIVGKEQVLDLLLTALLAQGHVLIEDVPGTGKTLIAKSLARSLACSFKRIQFTPDLLPSDISGITFFNQREGAFEFRPGPLFAQLVLADEINRATPRTQSSLLECMEERQVTVEGETHSLEQPFLVLATQNPIESQGTFPLPEAQLDRFLIKIRMGYPSAEESVAIIKRFMREQPFNALEAVASAADVTCAQREVSDVLLSDEIVRYIVGIVEATRVHPEVVLGASPRAGLAMMRAAQAYAAVQGRSFVIPEDIRALAEPVLAHRLVLTGASRFKEGQAESLIGRIVQSVPVPLESDLARG